MCVKLKHTYMQSYQPIGGWWQGWNVWRGEDFMFACFIIIFFFFYYTGLFLCEFINTIDSVFLTYTIVWSMLLIRHCSVESKCGSGCRKFCLPLVRELVLRDCKPFRCVALRSLTPFRPWMHLRSLVYNSRIHHKGQRQGLQKMISNIPYDLLIY